MTAGSVDAVPARAPVLVLGLGNLLLGARYGRKWGGHEAHERAGHLLERVGLSRWHHHRPSTCERM